MAVVAIAAIGGIVYKHHGHKAAADSVSVTQKSVTLKTIAAKPDSQSSSASVPAPAASGPCSKNTLNQEVIVSVSSQHMWACSGDKTVYDNPVITGKLANDDSTPLGDYKIFGQLTDQTLKGCDASGCWNDPVSYWLPYQQADGGTVGFHDATWRADSEFGNTPPASNKGSHGCVEMPLAAAKWLYNWSSVGTNVTIQA